MSDEGRRVFAMETVLGVIAGKGGEDVLDLLGYAVQRSVCECCRPAVTPIVKGWLYTLNPEFMNSAFPGGPGFDLWVDGQKKKLGDNISLPPLPAQELEGVNAMLDAVAAAKQTAEDKTAEAADAVAAKEAAEADAKAMAPFRKKAEDLDKKAKQLEEKNGALTAEAAELKKQLAEFSGKVAVDEKGIDQAVKDIVSKAVKEALGALVASGAAVGGAAAAAEGMASFDAPAEEAPASGGVPDTFGFGASGSDGDGFGF